MELTKDFLKAKRPCADGFRWFIRNRPSNTDYQDLLDALVAAGRVGDACWLLDQFGPVDTVRVLDTIDADAVVFAGSLHVRRGIDVDTVIRAGGSIRAGGGLRAGRAVACGADLRVDGQVWCGGTLEVGGALRAGWGLDVGETLRCGGDLRVAWSLSAGGPVSVGGGITVGYDLLAHGRLDCGHGLRAGAGVAADGAVRVGRGIVAGGTLRAGGHLEAGWGIRADGSIVVDGAIRAGEGIESGEEIRAGDGYGVYAGLAVRRDAWEVSAPVRARARPEGLTSGWWAGEPMDRRMPPGIVAGEHAVRAWRETAE